MNRTCVPTAAFLADSVCSWGHEGKHLDSATASAKRAQNDVHTLFESRVHTSAALLQNLLDPQYQGAYGRVNSSALSAHNAMTLDTNAYYVNFGSGAGWEFRLAIHLCP